MNRRTTVRIVTWLAAAVLLALAVRALLPKPIAVDVAPVTRGRVVQSISADGKTRLEAPYRVAAPVAGVVSRIARREGDPVRAGEPVAWIRPLGSPLLDPASRDTAAARARAARSAEGEARATVERARAALEQARRELLRAEALAEAGALARSTRDDLALQFRTRRADLAAALEARRRSAHERAAAEAALGPNQGRGTSTGAGTGPGIGGSGRAGAAREPPGVVEVRAPVDGRILRVRQKDEAPVATGAPLFEVGDTRALEIVADVLSTDAVTLRPGMPAELSEWGGTTVLHARVRVVEPAGYTRVSPLGVEEQRVDVILDFEGAVPPGLGDAFSLQVRFLVSEAKDARRVPVGAVFRGEHGWAAFVVRDGRARRVPVRIGRTDSEWFELLDGPAEGEEVIVHPGERVTDGVRVVAR